MGELNFFDEDDAVKFIRAAYPEKSDNFSDDLILYIIDCIWDWYEKNGMLEINANIDDDNEVDVDVLAKYVIKELKRAGESEISAEDVTAIINAELKYEESLEDF